MNKEKKNDMYYEAPSIEVLEVEVEKGFATSETYDIENPGGNMGGGQG